MSLGLRAVSPAPPDPGGGAVMRPGGRIGRYELLYALAEGGMGSVWIARTRGSAGFEKLVAVKTILPRSSGDPKLRAMFLDEARIASRIDHPNVVHVFDLGEEKDGDRGELLYLVMERVEGDSLARFLAWSQETLGGRRLPPALALRLVAQVASGLHAAHELRGNDGAPLGVVHRDVAPSNVLIGPGGLVKVIDFGIARAQQRLAADQSAGPRGRVRYMAPEQAAGRAIDRRADVWSAGALLYELIGGAPPFAEETEVAVLRALLQGQTPAPLPGLLPQVQAIFAKTLATAPDDRYADAGELQRACESAARACERAVTGLPMLSAIVAPFLEACASAHVDRMARAEAAISAEREIARAMGLTFGDTTGNALRVPEPQGALPGVAYPKEATITHAVAAGPARARRWPWVLVPLALAAGAGGTWALLRADHVAPNARTPEQVPSPPAPSPSEAAHPAAPPTPATPPAADEAAARTSRRRPVPAPRVREQPAASPPLLRNPY